MLLTITLIVILMAAIELGIGRGDQVSIRLPSGAVLTMPGAVAPRIKAAIQRAAQQHDPTRCRQCAAHLSDREQHRRLFTGLCDDCRTAALSSDMA